MSGKRVRFIGDAMAAVVQGVEEVRTLVGHSPVVVGGLAVMCRLSSPYRATADLDVVDRLLGEVPQLQVLRAARGAEPVEPASVLLPAPTSAARSRTRTRTRLSFWSGPSCLCGARRPVALPRCAQLPPR